MGATFQTKDVSSTIVNADGEYGPRAQAALWPIRYKPLPDELLSSWLVRLAHGHGLKVQSFCNLLFGNRRQVWNRDIDRLAPPWLVDALAVHTGTPAEIARRTTLQVFEGTLYPHFHPSGTLLWIQNMQMYHRQREGVGQQFCPECLATDSTPYFRKTWRVSLKTFCLIHNCLLLDHCHACGAAVAFHRVDMNAEWVEDALLSRCHECGQELGSGPRIAPAIWDDEAFLAIRKIISALDVATDGHPTLLAPGTLAVLRHLCTMQLGHRRKQRLQAYLTEIFRAEDLQINSPKRVVIESLGSDLRHNIIVWAAWLLCAPGERIEQAIAARAVQFNHFLRDFDDPPQWYLDCVRQHAGAWRRYREMLH